MQPKLTHTQAVQQLTMAMQHTPQPVPSTNVPLPPTQAATNLAPLLAQAQQHAQQQVQQHVASLQLQQKQQQLHQQGDSSNPTSTHVNPPPLTQSATQQPIPPMLDSIETEEGFFVDDHEFELAQSRVKRWLELEAEISTLSAALRERRKQREDLNKHIIAFMQGNQVPHFEMSKGNLSLSVSKHKQPLNQKWIASRIQAVEGISPEAQAELMRQIFEERSVTEKPRLKHLKGAAKKK